jgi:protein-tyrosine phosphatase
MAAAYWIKKGLSASKAIEKVRKSRPGAIEIPEQEESLFELEASIEKETERDVGAEHARKKDHP